MKKFLLFGIVATIIASPTFATVDITADANNPGCNNTVLHTYSAPTSLEAEYTANTINLKWYGADGEITTVPNASKTCTYDGAIILPTTNPTRTGYTFAGWQVRSTQAQCNVSGWANGGLGSGVNGASGYFEYDGDQWIDTYVDGVPGDANYYNLTEPNTIAVETSAGVIYIETIMWHISTSQYDPSYDFWGETSDIREDGSWTGYIPNAFLQSHLDYNQSVCADENFCGFMESMQDVRACYFRVTGFKPNGGTKCSVQDSVWVRWDGDGDIVACTQSVLDNIDDITYMITEHGGYTDTNYYTGNVNYVPKEGQYGVGYYTICKDWTDQMFDCPQ